MKKSTSATIATAILLLANSNANANILDENDISLGLETGTLTGGLSIKMPFSDILTAQGVIGFFGTLTSYTARGLYNFSDYSGAQVYGYGAATLWETSNNFAFASETAFGVGGGVGIDYNLQLAFPDLPPISVNAEVGVNLAQFDNFGGFNTFGLGIGVHYRF